MSFIYLNCGMKKYMQRRSSQLNTQLLSVKRSRQLCEQANWSVSWFVRDPEKIIGDEMMNGRFYTRGRNIRLDELGQTFVVRLVMRLKHKDGHNTYFAFGRIFLRNTS